MNGRHHASSDSFPKPVIISTRLGPNYLWHMLAVAKIRYDSEYVKTFRKTVYSGDLEHLESKKHLLGSAEGEGGMLAGFFDVLPAWLRVESRSGLEKYFAVLDDSVRRGSLQPFVEEFEDADWSDRFFCEFLKRDAFPDKRDELVEAIGPLSDIYLRNYDAYCRDVWPEAQRDMRQRAFALSEYCRKTDFVAMWENLLGIPFAANQYEIVLCYANKSGPDYISLGYSGNLFYFDKPLGKTCQFLSHEIGSHLLIDVYFRLAATGKFEHRSLYAAYETLTMFFNSRILGIDQLDYSLPQMNDTAHLAIYDRTYRNGIDAETLILKALTGC